MISYTFVFNGNPGDDRGSRIVATTYITKERERESRIRIFGWLLASVAASDDWAV